MYITRSKWKWAVAILLFITLAATIYGLFKPVPAGTSYKGEVHYTDDLRFLLNRSSEQDGDRVFNEEIYSAVLEAVEEAESFVAVEMFLLNDKTDGDFPPLSLTLTEALIDASKRGVNVYVLTDPINTSYFSHESTMINMLDDAGVQTIMTDITRLQDSNPLYSGIWRAYLQWFGQGGNGWIENVFEPEAPQMTVRSFLKLMNGRANHRKVVITEETGFVMSANFHDESYFYTNTAFQTSGPVLYDLLETVQAVSDFSDGPDLEAEPSVDQTDGEYAVQVLTEGENFNRVQEMLDDAAPEDTVYAALYFLADTEIVDSIEAAAERGTDIRLILDPNESAFGMDVFGMPNRPVAEDLMNLGMSNLQVRWYNTGDEQFHPKMMAVFNDSGLSVIAGSANFTSRNMRDNNLDTNLYAEMDEGSDTFDEIETFFNEMWTNEESDYTLPYEHYLNPHSSWREWIYRFQKISGLSTY
ncbi:phospholipase D-like domain-containing protein [Bacillus daqingensis]|uniref:Phospholipase D-like domain-containing protein n=1 Tax=Bacillus daqingensis TaxID=872396 RepID=A0ABV9P0Y7_9BACI